MSVKYCQILFLKVHLFIFSNLCNQRRVWTSWPWDQESYAFPTQPCRFFPLFFIMVSYTDFLMLNHIRIAGRNPTWSLVMMYYPFYNTFIYIYIINMYILYTYTYIQTYIYSWAFASFFVRKIIADLEKLWAHLLHVSEVSQ